MRLETIIIDSHGNPIRSDETGRFRCDNCGAKFDMVPGEPVIAVEAAPRDKTNRVRSSVSAQERGMLRRRVNQDPDVGSF